MTWFHSVIVAVLVFIGSFFGQGHQPPHPTELEKTVAASSTAAGPSNTQAEPGAASTTSGSDTYQAKQQGLVGSWAEIDAGDHFTINLRADGTYAAKSNGQTIRIGTWWIVPDTSQVRVWVSYSDNTGHQITVAQLVGTSTPVIGIRWHYITDNTAFDKPTYFTYQLSRNRLIMKGIVNGLPAAYQETLNRLPYTYIRQR